MKFRMLGAVLIILALALFGYVWYHNSQKRQQSIIFSKKLMISSLWHTYKQANWDATYGRTMDSQRGGITTSEGQSYTLLRAVWMDDKDTFDKTWSWTKSNLQRTDSHLFSWMWGQRPDGSFGIQTEQGGQNAATDADQDIALALIFASKRWNDPTYLDQAKLIITDIWNYEVIEVKGQQILASNNIEKNSSRDILVNPSYFAPYAYRIFAQVDPSHDWNKVIDSSYDILIRSLNSNLDKPASAGLPPDWVTINRDTGKLTETLHDNLTTNYGFDGLRVPFRFSLDWFWNKDSRAKELLGQMGFLDQQWKEKKQLVSTYSHDGNEVYSSESPAMYGGSIGYFMVQNEKTAQDVYKNKLEILYGPDTQTWKQPLGYYDDNWAWFGIALYNGTLINLYQ